MVSTPATITNDDLDLSDIPACTAGWDEIEQFALTFSGYDYWGSFEKCAEIANAHKHQILAEIRTCLFFEQRRWRHFGYHPDEEAMLYIRSLIEKIRSRVEAR